MSILSDTAIEAEMRSGRIVITPYDENALGGNSYDVHLSPHLMTYKEVLHSDTAYLDCKKDNPVVEREISERDGYLLRPGILYLASTLEYTETHEHVPYLDGKSSIGRLGIFIHTTAGRGDVGFCGHWTMEISVLHPIRVYAGMPIGQLTFHTVEGEVERKYKQKTSSVYKDVEHGPKPVPSRMWKNFK